MASERQLVANRRNARKSTGPKTSEGKSRSSRNNSKFGLYSNDVVLPGEDPKEYAAFVAGIVGELRPASPTEEYLVGAIALARWRLLRLVKTHTGVFEDRMEHLLASRAKLRTPAPGAGLEPDAAWRRMLSEMARSDALSTNVFEKISREEERLHRRVFRALAELRKIRKGKLEKDFPEQDPSETACENNNSNPIPKSDTSPPPPPSPAEPAPLLAHPPEQPSGPLVVPQILATPASDAPPQPAADCLPCGVPASGAARQPRPEQPILSLAPPSASSGPCRSPNPALRRFPPADSDTRMSRIRYARRRPHPGKLLSPEPRSAPRPVSPRRPFFP
ncbi:MAG: hypothetical protein KIT09_09300 [Bryobacteraceae bacterium]|nr:hypothetical protein [Bryobacteraceae bacterium]